MYSTIFLTISVFVLNDVCLSDECGRFKFSNNLSFPWNVAIYLGDDHQAELVCFGSLIQSNIILTAAHCFSDNLSGNIRNETFYVKTKDFPKEYIIKPSDSSVIKIHKNSIHLHKYYEGIINFFENDLALIKDQFLFNDETGIVCIDWSGEIIKDNPYSNRPIWNNNKITIVEQTNVYLDECYNNVPKNFVPFITQDKYCSKLETSDLNPYHANEGAGIFFRKNNRWYIEGVISRQDSQLSTYTPVHQYINWISNVSI